MRFALKRSLKTNENARVVTRDLIKTENNQDRVKVMKIVENFDKRLFDKNPISVLNWGCGLLILDGHHRAIAARIMGFKKIIVKMHRFSC